MGFFLPRLLSGAAWGPFPTLCLSQGWLLWDPVDRVIDFTVSQFQGLSGKYVKHLHVFGVHCIQS